MDMVVICSTFSCQCRKFVGERFKGGWTILCDVLFSVRSHMDHRFLMAHTYLSVCPFLIINVPIAKRLSSSLLCYTLKYNTKYVDACTSTTYADGSWIVLHGYTSCSLTEARVVELSHVLLKKLTWPGWCDLEQAGTGNPMYSISAHTASHETSLRRIS
jgi:hypothetical protein